MMSSFFWLSDPPTSHSKSIAWPFTYSIFHTHPSLPDDQLSMTFSAISKIWSTATDYDFIMIIFVILIMIIVLMLIFLLMMRRKNISVHNKLPDIIWTRYFVKCQGYDIDEYIVFQDNMSSLSLEKNGRMSSSKRTKHIKAKYFLIKDYYDSGEIDL